MNKKAQAGLELLTFVSLSMLVFSGFYLGILKKDINAANRQESLQAEAISENIAFEIRTAKSTGDGYARNFTLKSDIYGNPYSIRLEKNMVLVDVGNRTYVSNGFMSNISGSITAGCNIISNAEGNISVIPC